MLGTQDRIVPTHPPVVSIQDKPVGQLRGPVSLDRVWTRQVLGRQACCRGKLLRSPSLPSHSAAWVQPREEMEGRPHGQEGGTGPTRSWGAGEVKGPGGHLLHTFPILTGLASRPDSRALCCPHGSGSGHNSGEDKALGPVGTSKF